MQIRIATENDVQAIAALNERLGPNDTGALTKTAGGKAVPLPPMRPAAKPAPFQVASAPPAAERPVEAADHSRQFGASGFQVTLHADLDLAFRT